MKPLSTSPERGQFQRGKYLERKQAEGIDASELADDLAVLFDNIRNQKQIQEADPAWRENNMEADLRQSEYMCVKVRDSEAYAQNLYAAMCNREFQKRDVAEILRDSRWSCSWRYAGGIVADMRGEGDYIEWYCSGIRERLLSSDEEAALTPEQRQRYEISRHFVGEGVVTDEVRTDLLNLGWLVMPDDMDDVT